MTGGKKHAKKLIKYKRRTFKMMMERLAGREINIYAIYSEGFATGYNRHKKELKLRGNPNGKNSQIPTILR